MKPIIKWPGGKSGEIQQIEPLIPEYERYIEPFFGGGALYFHLMPQAAAINDVSQSLITFYRQVQKGDPEFRDTLMAIVGGFRTLLSVMDKEAGKLVSIFLICQTKTSERKYAASELDILLHTHWKEIYTPEMKRIIPDKEIFQDSLKFYATDKLTRTIKHSKKARFTENDLRECLITGFASGYYMYFRGVLNDLTLGRLQGRSEGYQSAVFYFIREYCYGSMFRYNARGEFNIPYGGMSYNRKDIQQKLDALFCQETQQLLSGTEIHCEDFEKFLSELNLSENDFLFLDPPYDSDFSTYDQNAFTHSDQKRLASFLKTIPAKFMLVIKKTDFIYDLYAKDFHIMAFDKRYTYNICNRNDRGVSHLIITNYLPN